MIGYFTLKWRHSAFSKRPLERNNPFSPILGRRHRIILFDQIFFTLDRHLYSSAKGSCCYDLINTILWNFSIVLQCLDVLSMTENKLKPFWVKVPFTTLCRYYMICHVRSAFFISIVSLVGVLNFDADQLSVNSFRNADPDHYWLSLFNWSMDNPLLNRSAGFYFLGICLHYAGCVNDWISPMQFATKVWIFDSFSCLTYQRTVRLLHQNVTFSMLISYTSMVFFVSLIPKDALNNSNLRMFVFFNRVNLVSVGLISFRIYRMITNRQLFCRVFTDATCGGLPL